MTEDELKAWIDKQVGEVKRCRDVDEDSDGSDYGRFHEGELRAYERCYLAIKGVLK